MDNKPHILQYALNKFSIEYSGFERKIQIYLDQQQMNEIVRSIHSLKGVAAHLHAVKLLAGRSATGIASVSSLFRSGVDSHSAAGAARN